VCRPGWRPLLRRQQREPRQVVRRGAARRGRDAADPTGGPDHYSNVWFARRGYAVVNYSARGFGNSCGRPDSRLDPGCLRGWLHLADQRYEVHDTQHLLGLLVDEGTAKPDALAVTGISYGGGQSMMLAYLNDRVRQADGSFVPWTSPNGTPLKLAAAWPRWPWSNLVSSLTPNGRFLDFQPSAPNEATQPLGVVKTSYVSLLFGAGAATGFYTPPGVDSDSDLTTWFAQINQGEPENQSQRDIAAKINTYHQAFGIPASAAGTPPLLIQNGWADDLFPVTEALRAYNDLRARDATANVALQLADIGHDRGQNHQPVVTAQDDQGTAFLDQYVARSGSGAPAPGSVTAYTQSCAPGTPDGGPFTAASWPAIHPGAVRQTFAATQTVSSDGGDPQTGQKADPIAAGASCVTVADADAAGTAVYRMPVTQPFTLLGLPTISASLATTGTGGQLDSRLWDVGPDGKQTLVSRGAYRLLDNQTGQVTFQMFGGGWRFDAGHTVKLELLGRDAPYLRPSNGSFSVAVSGLTLELPTVEKPGTAGGAVVTPTIGRAPALKGLRLRMVPRRVHARRVTRFTITVFARDCARCKLYRVKGAKVRFGGRTYTTGARGTKHFKRRFTRAALLRARATRNGFRTSTARVRVLRR
jgi:hypothetical protein